MSKLIYLFVCLIVENTNLTVEFHQKPTCTVSNPHTNLMKSAFTKKEVLILGHMFWGFHSQMGVTNINIVP